MNSVSVRFGVKGLIPFMPNACVVRLKIKAKDFKNISGAVTTLKEVLSMAGQTDLADKIFFEMVG